VKMALGKVAKLLSLVLLLGALGASIMLCIVPSFAIATKFGCEFGFLGVYESEYEPTCEVDTYPDDETRPPGDAFVGPTLEYWPLFPLQNNFGGALAPFGVLEDTITFTDCTTRFAQFVGELDLGISAGMRRSGPGTLAFQINEGISAGLSGGLQDAVGDALDALNSNIGIVQAAGITSLTAAALSPITPISDMSTFNAACPNTATLGQIGDAIVVGPTCAGAVFVALNSTLDGLGVADSGEAATDLLTALGASAGLCGALVATTDATYTSLATTDGCIANLPAMLENDFVHPAGGAGVLFTVASAANAAFAGCVAAIDASDESRTVGGCADFAATNVFLDADVGLPENLQDPHPTTALCAEGTTCTNFLDFAVQGPAASFFAACKQFHDSGLFGGQPGFVQPGNLTNCAELTKAAVLGNVATGIYSSDSFNDTDQTAIVSAAGGAYLQGLGAYFGGAPFPTTPLEAMAAASQAAVVAECEKDEEDLEAIEFAQKVVPVGITFTALGMVFAIFAQKATTKTLPLVSGLSAGAGAGAMAWALLTVRGAPVYENVGVPCDLLDEEVCYTSGLASTLGLLAVGLPLVASLLMCSSTLPACQDDYSNMDGAVGNKYDP